MTTMRLLIVAMLCVLAAPLAANDVVVPDGAGGVLMLLPEPYGPGGEGLGEFSGDPGLPTPGWNMWPGAAWPGNELWRLKDGKLQRLTKVLGGGKDAGKTVNRRTLYAAFVAGGVTYALQYDGPDDFAGISQVIRVDDKLAAANGIAPAANVVLAGNDFMDAPAVSADGKRLAVRAFKDGKSGAGDIVLRIYELADLAKPPVESTPAMYGRPLWIDDSTLCVVAYDGKTTLSETLQAGLREPQPGKLVKLTLAEGKLTAADLLAGKFPSDFFARNVAWCEAVKKLVVARADGAAVAVELREAKPDATPLRVDTFDMAMGVAVDSSTVLAAGALFKDDKGKADRRFALTALAANRPRDAGFESERATLRHFGTDAHGGMIGLPGAVAILEPVYNPARAANPNTEPELLHTLTINGANSFESLRNPRALQRVSAIAARFRQIEEYRWRGAEPRPLRSTSLAFDITIPPNNQQIKNRKARYIEYYDTTGRGGKGRIRVEDNFSTSWIVRSVNGNGTQDGDKVYDNDPVGANGELDATAAARAGAGYDELLQQIDSRQALLFTGIERALEKGGLRYLGRRLWRDPSDGVEKRVFEYERNVTTAAGNKYRVVLSFIAGLPFSMTERANPHSLVRALMHTRLGGGNFGVVDIAFQHDKFVELPSIEDKDAPKMLLPRFFKAYQPGADGKPELQFSAEVLAEIKGDPKHLRGGKLACGYNEPGSTRDQAFTNLHR